MLRLVQFNAYLLGIVLLFVDIFYVIVIEMCDLDRPTPIYS
jgi:hypothetical protein